ncbi:acyltransferase family protein [Luteipulveratus flavus]|uniref:Acyltransferase n=1 Tax=Luteipulveratus flavus TaxID=3031728 RepID=A0ABT6CEP9_9MICO|nr:acyltransferase [Luteipulveratus sp. YIM 133296]MDF8266514.1 acyltransferase [Luteipulveratus sp. YIM 133296]
MTSPAPARGPHAKKPELRALTGLRAVAALAVVLSHTGIPRNAPEPLHHLVAWGYIGVPLFFLLSGFVLAYNYPQLHFHDRRRTALFYIARVARVMPLYWVMVAYCAVYYFAIGHEQYHGALLQNLLAVQTWGPDVDAALNYYNGPGWSIGVELFFYLLFPFVAPLVARVARRWSVRGLVAVIAAATLALVLVWAYFVLTGRAELPSKDPGSAHRWLYRNPLPHLAEFVTGLALAHLLPRLRQWPAAGHHVVQTVVVAYVLGLAMFRPTTSQAVNSGSFGALFLLPFALGILSLASGQGWLARWCSTRAMVALGTASYALYITHRWLVWQLSSGKVIQSAPGLRGYAALAVTLAVLLVVAEGAHRYVEVPARRGIMTLTHRVLSRREARANVANVANAEPSAPHVEASAPRPAADARS